MDALINIGLILFFFYIMYMANQVQLGTVSPLTVRSLLYLLIGMLITGSFFILAAGVLPQTTEENVSVSPAAGIIGALIGGGAALLCLRVIQSRGTRLVIQRLTGEQSMFNPASIVHITAVVLLVIVLSGTVVNFVLIGGIQGLAESMASNTSTQGLSTFEPVFQMVMMVAASFLGVGYAIRRNTAQAMERIGLRVPREEDLRAGVGIGVLLFIVSIVFGNLWQGLVSQETFEQQTEAANQLAQSINTLGLAFLISVSAAVGEEILMRGALQPVFGVIITSLFFTLLHSQYLLTPTTLLIFGVSLGLAWLRNRYSTTAAIIAHFIYNFIPLVLLVLVSGSPPAP